MDQRDPDETSPPETPDALFASLADVVEEERPPSPLPPSYYLFLGIIGVAGAIFVAQHFMYALVISPLVCAAFWVGFYRANPRWVAVALVLIITIAFPVASRAAVVWMGASAMGGAMGALLTRRGAGEDDFFFLPVGITLGFFFLAATVVYQGHLDEALQPAAQHLEVARAELGQLAQQGKLKEWLNIDQDMWESRIAPNMGQHFLGFFILILTLGIWLTGRLVRRWLGHLQPHRHALILFKMRQPYIFLLIAGLFLAIVVVLSEWTVLSYLSSPLMYVCMLAGFIEGVAVIVCLGLISRAVGRPGGQWLSLAGIFVVFSMWPVGTVLGWSDVWFDYRKCLRPRVTGEQ